MIEQVSARHQVPVEAMFGRRRTARVLAARRHAWDEIGRLIKPDGRPVSSVQIGLWFGVDHTTVLYGVRRHRSGRLPFVREPGRGR